MGPIGQVSLPTPLRKKKEEAPTTTSHSIQRSVGTVREANVMQGKAVLEAILRPASTHTAEIMEEGKSKPAKSSEAVVGRGFFWYY